MTEPLQAGFGLEELRAAIGSRLFLTVPEGADLTRVDPRTLRRSIEAGECPHVRISGSVRIPVGPFLRWAGLEPEDETAPVGKTGAVALIKTPDTTPDFNTGDDHNHPRPAA